MGVFDLLPLDRAAQLWALGAAQPHPSQTILDIFGLPRRRVFITFASGDIAWVDYLRRLAADPAVAFEVYDESLKRPFDSTDGDYIRRGLREQIARSSVTICLVGPTTYLSRWVDFELWESLKKGNTVIAMGTPGQTWLTLPRVLRQMRAPWFSWDVSFLKREIDGAPDPVPNA